MQKQRGQFQSTPCQKSRKEIEIKRNQDFFLSQCNKNVLGRDHWRGEGDGRGGGGHLHCQIIQKYHKVTFL